MVQGIRNSWFIRDFIVDYFRYYYGAYMSLTKRTFYPVPEIEARLTELPRKKLSAELNRLLLKGVAAEREERVAEAYRDYDRALAGSRPEPEKEDRIALKALFQEDDDDEGEGWYE